MGGVEWVGGVGWWSGLSGVGGVECSCHMWGMFMQEGTRLAH